MCLFCFSTAGITLALFGGVQKYSTDKNKVPVRGDIHIIVVGMHKSSLAHIMVLNLNNYSTFYVSESENYLTFHSTGSQCYAKMSLKNANVISLGDPGLGKSQLLQAAAAISPRGIYVCGNATTNAGLTVAVVKDPMTSDYAFEAGTCFPPPPSLPPSLSLSLNYLILFLLSLKVYL